MRLSCPNCGAQYEVPVEVIPQDGRDVQCSNCGHTWFQIHPDNDTDLAQDVGTSLPDQGWSPEEIAASDAREAELVEDPAQHGDDSEVQPPEPRFDDDEPEADDEDDEADEVEEPAEDDSEDGIDAEDADDTDDTDQEIEDEEQDTPQPPRGIDPAIANVLRQEAEFEAQARESESRETLETQTELGLQEPASRAQDRQSTEARDRMRHIQGLDEQAPPAAQPDASTQLDDVAHASRRDLLPNIDDINSTLRSSDDPAGGASASAVVASQRKRSGFRLGFGLVMLLAALVILAYVYNREVVAAYPAAEPTVQIFMETMNGMRVWLDTRVTEGMLWLEGVAGSAGGQAE